MKAPNLAPPGDTDYLVLYGSHAHGTATATSDEDWRGVYRLPNDAFLGLDTPPRTWTAAPDVVMWELGHFCQLLLGGNPNIVGLLSVPGYCIDRETTIIAELRLGRSKFVTRRMGAAYLGWIETEFRHADIPAKRLSHIPRLYWELVGAVETGIVPVRLAGSALDYVMAVKRGEVSRAEVEDLVVPELEHLWTIVKDLPESPRAWVQELLLAARHGEL
jgi:predicted nucleotidyltransferase